MPFDNRLQRAQPATVVRQFDLQALGSKIPQPIGNGHGKAIEQGTAAGRQRHAGSVLGLCMRRTAAYPGQRQQGASQQISTFDPCAIHPGSLFRTCCCVFSKATKARGIPHRGDPGRVTTYTRTHQQANVKPSMVPNKQPRKPVSAGLPMHGRSCPDPRIPAHCRQGHRAPVA